MACYLVRYGAVPEVARFVSDLSLSRGEEVVVRSPRGLLLGTVLEREAGTRTSGAEDLPTIERRAEPDDRAAAARWQQACEQEFEAWSARIADWNLSLELLDLEWTLDRGQLILYVLTDRGPAATQLALHAAAAGLGSIHVQPVQREGVLSTTGRSCGTGGCGCARSATPSSSASPAPRLTGALDPSP